MSFVLKKVRKFFPKKGPEKKALMFLSNLARLPKGKASEVYKKVLSSKAGAEREVLVRTRKAFSSRKEIFSGFSSLVADFRKRNPNFEGVIIFGGVVKKPTPPTDLDFIFVGNLPDSEKKLFCSALHERFGIPPNPFPVKIDLHGKVNPFDSLLSVPYLHAPEEWTVQNFVGPNSARRKLMRAYNSSLKRIKPARIPTNE